MLRTSITSRERVRLALEHQCTDRIPIAMVCSGINPPAWEAFQAFLKNERGVDAQAYLNPILDILRIEAPYRGPALPPGTDIWGVHRVAVSYGPGSYDEIDIYPLANTTNLAEIGVYPWPDIAWFDYASLRERIAIIQADGERCLMIANANPFETSWYLRGLENLLLDFSLNPELAHAILERVTDFYVQHFCRLLEAADGQVDLAFTADDIAGQNGLLISPMVWECFIKPCHQRINQVIHEFGVKVIYHSDGAVMAAVPGLIDMGIDVLQALQFSAKGMHPRLLKDNYGDRLCFQGGVSVQTTLPFGTPEQVRQEVEDLITILGKNGGYIFGPSHAIQAGTPPENILALFEAALSFYPY